MKECTQSSMALSDLSSKNNNNHKVDLYSGLNPLSESEREELKRFLAETVDSICKKNGVKSLEL